MRSQLVFFVIAGCCFTAQRAWSIPISISAVSGLIFGTCVQGDGPKVVAPSTSENATNASFLVSGDANTAFTISLPTSPVSIITGGGGANRTLTVSSFVSFPSGTGLLSAGGSMTIFIGATLGSVAVAQVAGAYSGTFVVTVVY